MLRRAAPLLALLLACSSSVQIESGAGGSGGHDGTTGGASAGAGTSSGSMCTVDAHCGSSSECSDWRCDSGACVQLVAPEGTPCGMNACCGPDGTCLGGCVDDADCAPSAPSCVLAECGECGQCQVSYLPQGTPLVDGVAGDCKTPVCDGAGDRTLVADDSDLPAEDGNPCTVEGCAMGTPTSTPLPDGTACGLKACCWSGQCMTNCISDNNCPIVSLPCYVSFCDECGACQVVAVPDGTSTPLCPLPQSCTMGVCS